MVQILVSFIFYLYLCRTKVQQSNIRSYETVNGSGNGGNNDSAYSKRYQAD